MRSKNGLAENVIFWVGATSTGLARSMVRRREWVHAREDRLIGCVYNAAPNIEHLAGVR